MNENYDFARMKKDNLFPVNSRSDANKGVFFCLEAKAASTTPPLPQLVSSTTQMYA